MSRMVFCRKMKQHVPGLAKPPYPGKKGQDIFENISKMAWDLWLTHQTMLINENHLSLIDPQARKFLEDEMEKFLSGQAYQMPKGYIPPAKTG